jgi:hypothetical protein
MAFENWLEKVDAEFIAIVGLDRDSWPDQDYWDMYESGVSAKEAVAIAIENEYGEEGLEAFGLELM